MTLDEAIKHCEDVAAKCFVNRSARNHSGKCANEHRQLAEWLRELKACKEQQLCSDAISREAALETILTKLPDFCDDAGGNLIGRNQTASVIRNLPSVTPKQKTGEILTDYEIYTDKEGFERRVKKTTRCSLCSCDLGWNGDLLTHYCPNCGVKLEYKGR